MPSFETGLSGASTLHDLFITIEGMTPGEYKEGGKDLNINFSHAESPGPIFIHKKEVGPYSDVHRFPPKIKADKENFPLTLIGYGRSQRMVFTKLIGDADVGVLISQIFNQYSEVEYLHARNAEAGCFI